MKVKSYISSDNLNRELMLGNKDNSNELEERLKEKGIKYTLKIVGTTHKGYFFSFNKKDIVIDFSLYKDRVQFKVIDYNGKEDPKHIIIQINN